MAASKRRRAYASGTAVPIQQSRQEIETMLKKHGADQFLSGSDIDRAIVGFRIKALHIRIEVPMPRDNEREERRRWRALVLVIKAKLEAVNSGIALLEDEFLAHTVMADGQTVGRWAKPQIEAMYKGGKMPPLLPGPKNDK